MSSSKKLTCKVTLRQMFICLLRPPPLLGFCLGWSRNFLNFAGSEYGQIEILKLLQNMVFNKTQHPHLGCPRNKQTNISVQTVTNRNRSVSVVFRIVSWNQKQNILVCFGVLNLYQNNWNKKNCFKTNQTNRNNTKQPKILFQNKPKKQKQP